MVSEQITIINKLGLHARAASKLVNRASQFESDILIIRDANRVNAKSIMGVMMLAASKGTVITLEADGVDEQDCLNAIVELINNRFDEAE
ncbi:MAG: HPr family phosphocarrier protein [Gammaproteobacteria bacterium]|nr:HPr family phosphocarrier protein [Gammaproteobacteria bacterium]